MVDGGASTQGGASAHVQYPLHSPAPFDVQQWPHRPTALRRQQQQLTLNRSVKHSHTVPQVVRFLRLRWYNACCSVMYLACISRADPCQASAKRSAAGVGTSTKCPVFTAAVRERGAVCGR